MMLVMTVIPGLVYTFAFTGFAQLVFPGEAERLARSVGGRDVGSELHRSGLGRRGGSSRCRSTSSLGRRPRPTNADAGYDPSLSLGSNLGPTNPCFVPDPRIPCLDDDGKEIPPVVVDRVRDYRELNDLDRDVLVPVDAVTASGSGLDPDISIANARLQAARVANERGLSRDAVLRLVEEHTTGRTIGILGEKRVNVLLLNLALDELAPAELVG